MAFRKDYLPVLRSAVKDLYKFSNKGDKWTPDHSNSAPHEHFCKIIIFRMHPEFRSLVLGLSALYDKIDDISTLEVRMIELIASTFRFPKMNLVKNFEQFITSLNKDFTYSETLGKEQCLDQYRNANFTSKAILFSYAAAFTAGLIDPMANIGLRQLFVGSRLAKYLLGGVEAPKFIEDQNNNTIPKFLTFYSKVFNKVTNQSMSSALIYLDNFWIDVDVRPQALMDCPNINKVWALISMPVAQPCTINKTWACCDLESDISKDITIVWKAMKYMIAPPSKKVLEMSEKQDRKHVKSFGYKLQDDSMNNAYPNFLACKFGDIPLDKNCNLFRKMFTTEGIGYTFNNAPFFKLFANTTDNRAFNEEMYETEYSDKDFPREILSNGKQLSLEFVIVLNKNARDVESHKIVIHDPQVLADTRNEAIELEPGLAYELTVTPSVTITDENALRLKPDKRKCLSSFEDGSLKIFGQYRQSACFFECQLKRAAAKCKCTPWHYPRHSQKVNICWHVVSKGCFEKEMERSNHVSCDCPNDCNSIHYGVGVQVKPLKERYFYLF